MCRCLSGELDFFKGRCRGGVEETQGRGSAGTTPTYIYGISREECSHMPHGYFLK